MAETPEQQREKMIARAMAKKYQIIIVSRDGQTRWRGSDTAMGDGAMAKWASNLNGAFVTRFYPSKKGWLVLDVRHAQQVATQNSFTKWINAPRGKTVFPTMEAAVMACIHRVAAG